MRRLLVKCLAMTIVGLFGWWHAPSRLVRRAAVHVWRLATSPEALASLSLPFSEDFDNHVEDLSATSLSD